MRALQHRPASARSLLKCSDIIGAQLARTMRKERADPESGRRPAVHFAWKVRVTMPRRRPKRVNYSARCGAFFVYAFAAAHRGERWIRLPRFASLRAVASASTTRLSGVSHPLPARPGADDKDLCARRDQHAWSCEGTSPIYKRVASLRRSGRTPIQVGAIIHSNARTLTTFKLM
jgi:hypothetical protein